ncbi:indolepyruvate oxidoreductase subunit beta [Maridesulfovibrio hydrothermalis]|uniref:Indolepyruvate oxidoreductase subunit iorB n=1 Tax=Maridesulfovibrio hydrothermalis AM13 = DSM 14728 TaxID=1121451 RepID=L0R7A9_9BACT|nr:indolepyruvate oxidoreductase subunit beta [Maridesulfovibrio hydrothermalis]CCO22075.1 Indolepyruvate oxidoreductase subunit iorB [Maridesulfovibrio hydrothermalis AM13 = DSM 14728]
MSTRLRIFMTGVGGQGTLTATNLLAQAILDCGIDVTAGEIHGMAQRGGVVESALLIGMASPKIGHGEADVILGFEPLETLRALPYLKPGGIVLSSTEYIPPLSVCTGKAENTPLETIKEKINACAGKAYYLPCQSLGLEAGAVQSGNIALLAALCATGCVPLKPAELATTIKSAMKPKIADINLKALELGVKAVS